MRWLVLQTILIVAAAILLSYAADVSRLRGLAGAWALFLVGVATFVETRRKP